MHDLKDIRKNLDFYKKKISERIINFDYTELLNLDSIYRDLIQKKEKLEQEKKILSKKKTPKTLLNQKV